MKTFITGITLLFVVMIFAISCNNTLTGSEYSNGKIQLKIDKANAPNGVVYVRATLTRDGYTPLTAMMNLLTDSTADLILNDLSAGVWHLKVDAMDDSMVVLYTGETDVNIMAGFTTQVSLTLEPTGQGTGSVHIYVGWGGTSNNYNWTDNPSNPVITGGNNIYDYFGVAQPFVIYDEGKYKIWFYGDEGSARKHVFYAESVDGINWNRHPQPVLSPGSSGTWDSWAVHPGAIIKEDNIYKMYYTGFANQYGPWYIGIATSTDGINWSKKPTPILSGGSGWEFQIAACYILKHNNLYYLYYIGKNHPQYKIGLAISSDGVNFTKYSGNPILQNDKYWENTGVLWPTIFTENNQYKMVYMDAQSRGFGMAYSNDGINWVKDQSNPFFRREQTSNNWAAGKIAYPSAIKVNNELRIYYSGYSDTYNTDMKIGFLKRGN